MLPADVEEDAFVSLKIKNEGVTPVRLTEIVPMNPVARHSSAGLVLDSFSQPITLQPTEEFIMHIPGNVSPDLTFQIKTDCPKQPSLICRIFKNVIPTSTSY